MNTFLAAWLALAGPPDLARFPDAATATAAWKGYCDYLPTLEPHLTLNADVPAFRERWEAWREACIWRRRAWDLLDNAHRAAKSGRFQNQTADDWLGRLREHLGDEAYREGRMPPARPE